MIFLQPITRFSTGKITGYRVLCPGCKQKHFYMTQEFDNHPVWSFNGDMEKPTFTPSLRANWNYKYKDFCCHFNLTNGIFEFQNDCTHSLSGQNHPMIEYKHEVYC